MLRRMRWPMRLLIALAGSEDLLATTDYLHRHPVNNRRQNSSMASRNSDIVQRGTDAAAAPTVYFAVVAKLSQRLWSADDPDGNIVMSIAENRLTVDPLRDRLQSTSSFPDSAFFYDNMTGSSRLKLAMIGMLQHTFMKGLKLHPDNLTISTGCGAIINNMIYCIAEAGDGIAIPGPYYPAFDYDLKCKNDTVPVTVRLSASDEPYDQQLQKAADEYESKTGKRLAAVLMTNPDNPTGTVYTDQHLIQMLKWCVSTKRHFISDEVYANSIFDPNQQFTSVAQLASKASQFGLSEEDVKSYVHIVFGLSKDWCGSGLRIGCLWTLNSRLQAALQNISYFSGVSGLVQHMVAETFEDLPFVKGYLKENLRRLKASYDVLAGALTKAGIKFTPAVACVFCWIDLRSALSEPTWEAERKLWEEGFVQRCGFIITPGESCHAAEPGFFRICYAIVNHETILQLVKRLSDFISKSESERQAMPLWISRGSLEQSKKDIEAGLAEPEATALQ